MSPALAKIMASYSASSSLRSRVLTLPRRNLISRSGRLDRNWHSRRKLEVPTTLPAGNASRVRYWLLTKASEGSSRAQITPSPNPAGNAMGTSFMECTAMSARPSNSASSSSFTNRPLPPTLASGTSSNWSPREVMPSNCTSTSGYA